MRRTITMVSVLAVTALGSGLLAAPSGAANGSFPQNFSPETTKGYPNTYTTKDVLTPACPQALAGTPGSDPATKVINTGPGIVNDFTPGGTVHYDYKDNPHTNGGTQNFTIQDCVVVYPAGFFAPGQIDPTTGVVTASKNQLTSGGTQIDGASLSGIASSVGDIYFSWTAPNTTVAPPGSYVCNFARDIKNDHGGGGNRKVSPTCYQVQTPIKPGNKPAEIYLGYADDFRGVDVHPSPWQGDQSPGGGGPVIFVGCDYFNPTVDCPSYDAGAIRIDNPVGNTPLTLINAFVDIDGCHFHPWDGLLNQTISPGQTLILTQTTVGGAPSPCDTGIASALRAHYNFDTSESPNEPENGAGNCDPNLGFTPQITLKFGPPTGLVVINDLNRVLNTGGVDAGRCFGAPESTGTWSPA